MDDTAEILARLDRIASLADAGVARPALLREVRGLLEEGERTLRAEPGSAGGAGDEGGAPVGPTADRAGRPSPRSPGEEATVS